MSQNARFFIVFAMQGFITLAVVAAAQSGNSRAMDMTAGAVMAIDFLMLVIWLFSNVAKNIR